MRVLALMMAIACLMPTVGCAPLENQARDAAAVLGGSLVAAQSKYEGSCQANPSQEICRLINRGVSAQNALITTIETYCGWAVAPAPADPNAKCIPVKSAEQALKAAIANAATLTTQIKGAM